MKKIITIGVVMFIVATFFILGEKSPTQKLVSNTAKVESIPEKRAVYLSYIELNKHLNGKNEVDGKKAIDEIIKNIKDNNLNMLILHTRSHQDAIYPSKIFPTSRYVVEKEGNELPFDILQYFIDKVHQNDIEVHAWINPYRIRSGSDTKNLAPNNIYNQWKDTDNVQLTEDGIFLNPAKDEVIDFIVSGIKEIIDNYDVDGIHFDDYFYPNKEIDLKNYEDYKNRGGTLSIDDYRLENVKKLIKRTYQETSKKDVLFGIAPEGNIDNNYSSNYLDTKTILKEGGYVDYIMPQIYFGYTNEIKSFNETIDEWSKLIKNPNIKLIPALALYKSGSLDKYAGTGREEWIRNNDIIKKQIITARGKTNYDGFSLFRYDNLINPSNDNMKMEISNLQSLLK